MPVELTCKNCHSSYSVKPSRADSSKFCSMECKSNYSRIFVNCDNCGDKFSKYKRRVKRSNADLCSEDCKEQYWSDSIAPNMGNYGSSETLICDYCSDTFDIRSSSREGNKSFCDIDCYGNWLSENIVGKNHPRYSEDSVERFTDYERNQIFERDNYTCQECGRRGEYLNAHHIKPVSESPESVHDIDNGLTLCIECHAEQHPNLRSLILSQKGQ